MGYCRALIWHSESIEMRITHMDCHRRITKYCVVMNLLEVVLTVVTK